MVTGVNNDPWGVRSVEIPIPLIGPVPLGLLIAPIVILLAAYSLVMDFSDIKRGVGRRGAEDHGVARRLRTGPHRDLALHRDPADHFTLPE